jgi:hypothetical protein
MVNDQAVLKRIPAPFERKSMCKSVYIGSHPEAAISTTPMLATYPFPTATIESFYFFRESSFEYLRSGHERIHYDTVNWPLRSRVCDTLVVCAVVFILACDTTVVKTITRMTKLIKAAIFLFNSALFASLHSYSKLDTMKCIT